MKPSSPAVLCLLIGAVFGVALWALGESTAAILIFVVEAIGWAVIYLTIGSERE